MTTTVSALFRRGPFVFKAEKTGLLPRDPPRKETGFLSVIFSEQAPFDPCPFQRKGMGKRRISSFVLPPPEKELPR